MLIARPRRLVPSFGFVRFIYIDVVLSSSAYPKNVGGPGKRGDAGVSLEAA